jgi:hypothetical protein
MDFKIPKQLYLGAQKINVNKVKQITGEEKNILGFAFYSEGKIELKDDPDCSNDYKEYIFFHELTHHILNQMQEEKLRQDEKFISRFAILLHQAIRTMR